MLKCFIVINNLGLSIQAHLFDATLSRVVSSEYATVVALRVAPKEQAIIEL